MFGDLLSNAGGTIAKAFGGGILSTIGRFAGKAFGDYLDNLNHQPNEYENFKNFKESARMLTANYGEPIPLIFGTARVVGKIIWASKVHTVANAIVDDISEYFPKLRLLHTQGFASNFDRYQYYFSFAVCICAGEISEINRVWANDQLISLEKFNFRLYKGTKSQLPDSLIENHLGKGKTPAFRDLCYIVFENLLLNQFNNSIPILSFEVTRKANVNTNHYIMTEDLIKAINIIPGSGEFVYDTLVQNKIIHDKYGNVISSASINSHNHYNIADSVFSLNHTNYLSI